MLTGTERLPHEMMVSEATDAGPPLICRHISSLPHAAFEWVAARPANGTLAKLQAGSHAKATRRGSCRA